jgi:hypothetical protein
MAFAAMQENCALGLSLCFSYWLGFLFTFVCSPCVFTGNRTIGAACCGPSPRAGKGANAAVCAIPLIGCFYFLSGCLMPFLIRRFILRSFLGGCVAWALTASPVLWANDCQPKTPTETLYCDLTARGVEGLPPLYEFRKNPPATQILLLKRPAQKFNLPLPNLPKRAEKKPLETLPSPPPARASAASVGASPPLAAARASAASTGAWQESRGSGTCRIEKEEIVCSDQRFRLQWNLPKSRLPVSALSDANQLLLSRPPARGAPAQAYLQQQYGRYLEKMLLLGLGASTLSFHKFAVIYDEVSGQGVDFADRFKTMYHFLKQDRKTLQPPKGTNFSVPQSLQGCHPVESRWWVCDQGGQNWVYAR